MWKRLAYKALLLLIVGIVAVLVLLVFYPVMFPEVRICESLQPGITETDLLGKLGQPYRREQTNDGTWLYFYSHPMASGPIRAKIDSTGIVLVLRCNEDGPPTWNIEIR